MFTFKRLALFFILACSQLPAFALSVAGAASAAANLKDFSGTASGLFNNMRTPAAIVGGAIVPLGILTAPPLNDEDTNKIRLLKKANMLLAIASLLSEILAITYSSVAINKLAEVKFPLTEGVSMLISNHFELAWIGTNVHFLFGLFGFGLLVGTKCFFTYGPKVGKIAGCWSVASFLQCTAIVNRGISMGSGEFGVPRIKFADNLLSLSLKYVSLLIAKAKSGILPALAMGILLYSFTLIIDLLMDGFKAEDSKAKKLD